VHAYHPAVASARLAIDLGTSHTVGVVHREGQQVRPLVFDGSPLLPSGVAVADDGGLVTGRDAQRIAQLWPDRYEPHPKRRVDEGSVLLGDRVYSVAELLAAVLRRVIAEAGPAAANAVLTCPADWGGPRRDVLREAARQAGLGGAGGAAGLRGSLLAPGGLALVDEPVAAAAYCMAVAGQRLYVGQALAVFDFGGGTLDVTVVRRDADQLRVLATGGLDDLGGLDIDAAVVGHLGHLVELRDPALWRRLQSPADAAQGRDRRTFWAEARSAKEMLSRTSTAPVQVPGRPDALHLTRDELERIAGPLIARAVDETRRVVERAGLATGSLAGVLLVGGSSRIPLVASRLHVRLGVAPTMPEQPELPVAHGALLVAGGAAPGPGATAGPVAAPQRPVPTSPAGWGTSDTVSGSPLFGSPGPGPISAAPYAGGSPVGAPPQSAPPGSPPGPPPPGAPVPSWPGQGPQPWAPRPAPKRKRRTRWAAMTGLLTTLLVVALVAGGVVWLGRKVAGGLGDPSSGSGQESLFGNPDGADGELKQVHDIALTGGGAGAVATDGKTAYYASSGADTTKVSALPMAGGKAAWATDVPFAAAELRLTVVSGLLLLDGGRSTLDGDARAVLDAGSGRLLWHKVWAGRFDLAYVGTDALIEQNDDPTGVSRVDLRTGKARWTISGPDFPLSGDDRLAAATRTWPAAAATTKPGDPVAAPGGRGMRESLRAGSDVVMLNEDTERLRVIDGRTGRVRRTAKVALDYETWTAYDGLVVGVPADGNDATVQAYRLGDLKLAWRFKLPAGSSIDAIRPCGPKLVCVVADPPSGGDTFVRAVDMIGGKETWNFQAPSDMIDVGWYVVDGKLVFGEHNWGSIGEASLMGTDGKLVRESTDRSLSVLCTDGGRAGMQKVRVAGQNVVWQVLVGQLDSGATTEGVDVGPDQAAGVALAGDSLVVVTAGASPRVRAYRVELG
jgi:hypothetical protein